MALLIESVIELRKATWYDKNGCSAKMYRYERERIADNPYPVCSSWYLDVKENALIRRTRKTLGNERRRTVPCILLHCRVWESREVRMRVTAVESS